MTVEHARFIIEGRFLADKAREMALSDMPDKAWKLLANGLVGEGGEMVARRVLEGTMTLGGKQALGDPTAGVYAVEETDPTYQEQLAYTYAGRWKSKHGWCKPIAKIVAWGPKSAKRAAKALARLDYQGQLGSYRRAWAQARADFYCRDHEFAELVQDGEDDGGYGYVIFKSCGEPPHWWKTTNRTAQEAVDDLLASGHKLRQRGKATSTLTVGSMTRKMIENSDLDDEEADRLRELAYAVEDEITAERHRLIGEEVRKRAGEDTFDLTLLDGRVVTVPRAPFVCWALRRCEDLAHHAPEWKTVSPTGLKLQGDCPHHSDWMLGADLPLKDAYEKNISRPAWAEAGRLQDRLRHPKDEEPKPFAGILAALEGLRSGVTKATVIVDAGVITGMVGEDVVVLPDLSPMRVSEVAGARAVIAETGGPTSHLAVVARGEKLTVLLVRDACERFEEGQRVTLDPRRGTVTLLEDDDETDDPS